MSAVAHPSVSASRSRRRHRLWALATVLALAIAVAPAVLAAGGDHGACGADWVKFEFSSTGVIGPASWSNPAPSTAAPTVSVAEWKEATEAVRVAWTHADTEDPVWTVAQVWLKAGSEHQTDGGLFGPYAGGDGGLAPSDGSLRKGISFVVFCFEQDPVDPPTEPTDPPTEPTDPPTEPTDPPTEPTDPPTEPTDPPTEPTEPTEPTDPPTEPEPADTEGVLPGEVETSEPEPTEPGTETPTTTPADQEQVEVLADSLPATGAEMWLVLLAGLLSLAVGTALVRRAT